MTGNARLSARYGRIQADVEYQRGHFDSIEGHDRHQDELTSDTDLTDSRRRARAAVGYRIPLRDGLTLQVNLSATDLRRSGTADEHSAATHQREYMGGVSIDF